MSQKKKLTIALGQMWVVQGDVEANLKKMEKMTAQASHAGADIICFPELSCNGYFVPKERVEALAEPLDGRITGRLAACGRENGIYMIAGFAEKAAGFIYNTCLLLDRDGSCIGSARKVHLWKSEKKRFSQGDAFPVFGTEFGKIAVINCYDLEFPEPSRIAALKGADIIFCPAAWSRDSLNRWLLDIRANALFNVLFVAGANFSDELCCGSSAIAGPDGELRLLASGDSEEVLMAEIDLEEIERSRKELPYYEDMEKKIFLRELKELL